MKEELVSIVMPSFNQARYLSKSIDSVLGQAWANVELIVMDGGSTDGSVEILRMYQERDSRLKWWSESDSGPAEAINKALKKCRGTIIGWLNSDDLYANNTIETAVQKLSGSNDFVMCYGDGNHIDSEGGFLSDYPTKPHRLDLSWNVPDVTQFAFGSFICQPCVFVKSTVYRLIGGLDESLKASFDLDYWIRVFKFFRGRVAYIPQMLAMLRLHNECITISNRSVVAIEGMRVLYKNGIDVPINWVISYIDECKKTLASDVFFDDITNVCGQAKKYLSDENYNELRIILNGVIDLEGAINE